MIKFNKHNVVNTETKNKVRVRYDLDNHVSGKPVVTIRTKSILDSLRAVFAEGVQNDTDSMVDYYEKDKVNLFEDHPLYQQARKVAELMS